MTQHDSSETRANSPRAGKSNDTGRLQLWIVSTLAGCTGLLFGFDLGIISGALPSLHNAFHLGPTAEGLVVGAVPIGAMVGAASTSKLAQSIGRRRTLIIAAILFALGAIASGLAASALWLVIARLFVGAAVGIGSMLAPLYLAEAAPPGPRGLIVSLNQFFITIGILASYGTSLGLDGVPHDWRWMLAIGAVPAVVLFVGMLLSPESPRWLVARGREDEAKNVLTRLHGAEQAEWELTEIREVVSVTSRTSLRELFTGPTKLALFVAVGLGVLQQVSGINTVINFAPEIFQAAGFTKVSVSLMATLGVGIVNVIFTIIALLVLDRLGRRRTLLSSLTGMTISLIALGAVFHVHGSHETAILSLVCVFVFIASFAVGMGPVFWLMASEIFPLRNRATGMAIATVCEWGTNYVVVQTFPNLMQGIGAGDSFWLYAGFCLLGLALTFLFVPETKGRSLEAIEHELRTRALRRFSGASATESG